MEIACEYASSPVEHPGTQMRMGPEAEVRACKIGRIDNLPQGGEGFRIAKEAGDIDQEILVEGVHFAAVAMQKGAIILYVRRSSAEPCGVECGGRW